MQITNLNFTDSIALFPNQLSFLHMQHFKAP